MKETRYSRNEGLFGAEGQRLIGETKVTIVGLGGLGCHIAQQTAYLGVVDDIVFGCLDRDLHRLSLTERCVDAGVPFFDLATDTNVRAGLTYGGRVLFSGDRERCPWCMDLVDQEQLQKDTMTPATRAAHERIYGVSPDALHGTGPAVVSINGVVASLAVTEFMAWRTGLRLPNSLLTYRADQGGVRPSRDVPRAGCPYCQATIGPLAS
jgi:hypothetical protein